MRTFVDLDPRVLRHTTMFVGNSIHVVFRLVPEYVEEFARNFRGMENTVFTNETGSDILEYAIGRALPVNQRLFGDWGEFVRAIVWCTGEQVLIKIEPNEIPIELDGTLVKNPAEELICFY